MPPVALASRDASSIHSPRTRSLLHGLTHPSRPSISFDPYLFTALCVGLGLPFVGCGWYERYVLAEVRSREVDERAKLLQASKSNSSSDDGTGFGSSSMSVEEPEEEEKEYYRLAREARARKEWKRKHASTVPEAVETDREDDDNDSDTDSGANSPLASSSTPKASACISPQSSPSPKHSSLSSSSQRSEPYFAWTWSSAFEALLHSFPLVESLWVWWFSAESTTFEQTVSEMVATLRADRKYFMHPRFYSVASKLSWGLWLALVWFVLVEDAELSIQSSLLYAIRFWMVAIAAFAAVSSVHHEGWEAGHKSKMRAREAELASIRVRVAVEGSEDLRRTSALEVLRSIDALSKQNKGLLIERRMVWLCLLTLIRGLIAIASSHASGSLWSTSLLYGAFHWALGFAFFALAVQTEFELHEDARRFKLFSAMHSSTLARKFKLGWTMPLAHFEGSQNIVAWWAIRKFAKEGSSFHAQRRLGAEQTIAQCLCLTTIFFSLWLLCCLSRDVSVKGAFDFARMQMLISFVVLQVLQVAVVPCLWSWLAFNHSVLAVYEHVLGSNYLLAFDTALCLSLLLDMVAAGVSINRTCGSHTTMLQEEELKRSFVLTSTQSEKEGDQVVDSIHQLKALRESGSIDTRPRNHARSLRVVFVCSVCFSVSVSVRFRRLTLVKETEKLKVYGFKLDEHITTVSGAEADEGV